MTTPTAPDVPDKDKRLTAADLARYVGAADSDTAFVEACLEAADELVSGFLGSAAAVEAVPAPVLRAAVQEVGADLFHRRKTRNGVASFNGDGDVLALRVNRDALTAAVPLLRPWTTAPIR